MIQDGHEFYCTKDADGRCPECVGKMLSALEGIVSAQREAMERVDREAERLSVMCGICGRDNFDYAIAKMVREIFPKLPPPMRVGLGGGLVAYAKGNLGLSAMPLSEKALRDVGEAP